MGAECGRQLCEGKSGALLSKMRKVMAQLKATRKNSKMERERERKSLTLVGPCKGRSRGGWKESPLLSVR